jgi:hypothetical protein
MSRKSNPSWKKGKGREINFMVGKKPFKRNQWNFQYKI